MRQIFFIASFLVLYTYFLYPAILFLTGKIVPRRKRNTRPDYLPKVSLLIAAYNEEKVIREKVENSLNIDYPREKIEIIVASDGSDDRTNEIVSSYREKGVKLFAYKSRRGKMELINKSIPKTEGKIVVLSDANTMYQPQTIKELVKHFPDPQIGCVCGELKLHSPGGNSTGDGEELYWRYETFLKRFEGARGALLGANGGIYAIRRELFEPLPAEVIIDDFVIPMKIAAKGYQVIFEPRAIASEETCGNIRDEFTRRVRIGAGNFQAIGLTSRLLNPFRGFIAFAYWSHKIIRWFVPFLLIIMFSLNIFLLRYPFYLLIFILQGVFYLSAATGFITERIGLKKNIFYIPLYFVAMNASFLLGFFRFVTGKQKVTWQRTER